MGFLGIFRRWLPALVWMSLIFYLSSKSGPGGPEWMSVVAHVVEYGILAVLYRYALTGTPLNPGIAVWLAVGLAALYGISDELHQSFVPGRVPDPFDILVDTVAAVAAVMAIESLKRPP